MRVCTPITIRYAETDMMGIVYHANYFLYFEDARCQFLEALGFPYESIEQAGYLSPVLDAKIAYLSPLTFGDVAHVYTSVAMSKPTRTVYRYEVYKQDQNPEVDSPVCTAETSHCLVDAATFKPVSIKRVMPELFCAYAQAVEDADSLTTVK